MRNIIDSVVTVALAASVAALALRAKALDTKVDVISETLDCVGAEVAKMRRAEAPKPRPARPWRRGSSRGPSLRRVV